MKTKIEIDTRTFLRFWMVIFGIVVVAALLYQAQTALIILGVSFFLAIILNKPVSLLASRLPGKSRIGATAIAYIVVVALLGAVVTLVIPPMVQQTVKVAQNIPAVVESAASQWTVVTGFVDQYNLQPQVDDALNGLQNNASDWAATIGAGLISGIGSFFSFMAMLLLVLVLTFLMLVEGPTWTKRVWKLYPDQEKMKQHRHVVDRMYTVVGGYVNGQIGIAAIGATFTALFVFILSLIFPDLPGTLVLPVAAITFVMTMIPMFGATIGGVIIGILLALNSFPAALIYVAFLIIYQQIENNFISPQIQAKSLDLSPLVILASVTIGLYMLGIIGGIIAIPIAGSIKVLIEEYNANRADKQKNDRTLRGRLAKKT